MEEWLNGGENAYWAIRVYDVLSDHIYFCNTSA